MAKKPVNTKLEKREEAEHKDLDHDDEKGEPMAHRIKVLGKAKAEKTEGKAGGKKPMKPMKGDKGKSPFPPMSKPSPKKKAMK